MDIIWVVFSLIGVLGLFFILLYGVNKLNKKVGIISGSKMRVLDRITVGRDGMIMVVSVGGKLMLIGATSQHIAKLCDIDMTPEEYTQQLQQDAAQVKSNFASVLASAMSRKDSGKENEND